jgi:hypothetical protein
VAEMTAQRKKMWDELRKDRKRGKGTRKILEKIEMIREHIISYVITLIAMI